MPGQYTNMKHLAIRVGQIPPHGNDCTVGLLVAMAKYLLHMTCDHFTLGVTIGPIRVHVIDLRTHNILRIL
jgi:hypothetical protein